MRQGEQPTLPIVSHPMLKVNISRKSAGVCALILPLALLVGCDSASTSSDNLPDITGNNIVDVAPPLPSQNGAVPTAAGNGASADAAAGLIIPARYHGEWVGVGDTCGQPTDSRLTVTERDMRFWESVGTVTQVSAIDEKTIEVDAGYEGEGDRWSRHQRLTLSDGGDQLVITDQGQAFRRKRCPG